jgi:prepilin-type processing-associated H-X9-DG protein
VVERLAGSQLLTSSAQESFFFRFLPTASGAHGGGISLRHTERANTLLADGRVESLDTVGLRRHRVGYAIAVDGRELNF